MSKHVVAVEASTIIDAVFLDYEAALLTFS